MGKTIDAKAESKKVEESHPDKNKSYTKWMGLVALTIIIFGFVGYKYLLGFADEVKTKVAIDKKQEISIKAERQVVDPEDFKVEIEVEGINSEDLTVVESVQEEPILEKIQEEVLSQTDLYQRGSEEGSVDKKIVVAQDSGLLDQLVKKQSSTIIYLAAKALNNSPNNEDFQDSLDFLEIAAVDEPTIKSKVNLLRMATQKGLEKKENILQEFKLASEKSEKANEKDLWENLESSVGELVKITKVEGDVANSYALYKQAKKALDKDDYEALIKISEKLGAEDLILKVNNLQRVDETLDFIIKYSKNKMVE